MINRRLLLAVLCLVAVSCRVGGGEGSAHGCVTLPGCTEWEGPDGAADFGECSHAEEENFSLEPEFFAAEPLSDGSLEIRIQKDGYWMGEADGLLILVPGYEEVSRELDAMPEQGRVKVVTVPRWDDVEGLPPSERYRASFYLNGSCHGSVSSFAGGTGTLRLFSLYRPGSDNAWIEGEFDLRFEDTRLRDPGQVVPEAKLTGGFKFEYQKGLPAQHFP